MSPSAISLSHARRICTRHFHLQIPHLQLPFPAIFRTFSSSAPVKPVSYPVKPKDPSDAAEEQPSSHSNPPPRRQQNSAAGTGSRTADFDAGVRRTWTREEARYLRDTPKISPVSYAPLPEPKPSEEVTAEGEGALKTEEKQIKTYTGVIKNIEEEVEKVPFPKLIRAERNPPKTVLDLQKAIKEVKGNAKRNFLETVEAHVRLGVNPRRSDQSVRGAVTLPHGTGKSVRVAVFADGSQADEARAAGADVVGGDELIEEIRKGGGKLNFDKCIATPAFMPRLGKIARILGPRGLMPNPKLGSVTSDVSSVVKEAKRGRVDFKMDKTAIVHVGIGKVNFSEEALRENIGAFVNALLVAKPAGLKKTSRYAGYVNSFSLSSTMGPGFPVSVQSLSEAAEHYNKLHPKTAA